MTPTSAKTKEKSKLKQLKKQFKQDTRLDKDDTFPFGKYAGHTLRSILERDPSYIVWWNVNIDTYHIRKKIVTAAQAAMSAAHRANFERYIARLSTRTARRYGYNDVDYDHDCIDSIWEDIGREESWGN